MTAQKQFSAAEMATHPQTMFLVLIFVRHREKTNDPTVGSFRHVYGAAAGLLFQDAPPPPDIQQLKLL